MLIPQDIDAEKAVIGSIIMEPKRAFDIIIDKKISGDNFFSGKCRMLFEAIGDIGENCDQVQVCDVLKKAGRMELVGFDFVSECADLCLIAHLEYHCDIIIDKLSRRKIISAAESAMVKCGDDDDPLEIASELGAVAVEISDTNNAIDKQQIVLDSLEIFDNARKGVVTGVPLPWDAFSRNVGGLQRRCVCPLLGRDGAGKSFLVAKILAFLGGSGIPALSIPFEDGADRQMRRMAGCVGGYSTGDIERSYYRDRDGQYMRMDDVMYEKLKATAKTSLLRVADMPIYFEDQSMTVEQIRIVAGKYKRKQNIQALFIDGIKDVVPSKGENGTKQEEHISRVLVQTAKELDIAIIPVCHLTDLPEDVLIQRRNMRGAKSQFHNARQVLIYQNAGLQSSNYAIGEETIALHMEKNNYGKESMMYLEKDFDHCDFTETMNLGY